MSNHLNFSHFVDQHPEILTDRHKLSFGRDEEPQKVAQQFRSFGAVMLRNVLSSQTLNDSRRSFERFVRTLGKPDGDALRRAESNVSSLDDGPSSRWDKGETAEGSYHMPWAVRHGDDAPAATVISEFIKSWAWPVIERICDSEDIVVMFGLCLARHRFDEDLAVGVHQDATAVNPEVPLSIWIPLGEVAPRRASGLGFIVPAPDGVLPAGPDNDVGPQYAIDNLEKVWVPHYQEGDLTIHSRYSPHFTTGYGTNSERYSLEIRLWAYESHLTKYYDPSIRVIRRNGVPVVTETKCTSGIGAHGFLAHTAQLAMQRRPTPPVVQQAIPPAALAPPAPVRRSFLSRLTRS